MEKFLDDLMLNLKNFHVDKSQIEVEQNQTGLYNDFFFWLGFQKAGEMSPF